MDLKLQNKVAFITGGARGIGKAIGKEMAKEGAIVVLNDLNAVALKEAVNELVDMGYAATGICGDVADPDCVGRMFEEMKETFGRVDILINNVGINHDVLLMDLTYEQWRKEMAVNLDAMFLTSKAAVPLMEPERHPVILNSGSFACFMPALGYGSYAAAKAAVESFTKSLCGELASKGIRVAGYAPGVTNTEINRELFTHEGERMCRQIPLNRVAEPEEIARVVVFLASEAASYVAGCMVRIDGGKLCVQNADRFR